MGYAFQTTKRLTILMGYVFSDREKVNNFDGVCMSTKRLTNFIGYVFQATERWGMYFRPPNL